MNDVLTSEFDVDSIPTELKFSPSRLSSYANCHMRGYYTYEKKLEPNIVDPKTAALELGSVIHDYMELWYRDDLDPAVAFVQLSDKYPGLESRKLLMVGLTLATRYVNVYADDKQKFKIYGVEKELITPYTTPNGTTVYLHGKLDLVADDQYGRMGVWDHKTSAGMKWTQDTVVFDTQLNQYLCMLYLLDVMPQYALINQVNTSSKSADSIAKKPREELFNRLVITPSPVRIETWLTAIGRKIDFILENEPTRNEGHRCVFCPFRHACLLQMDGKSNESYLAANFKPRNSPNYRVLVDLEGLDD